MGQKKAQEKANALERQLLALELRKAGHSYRDIGKRLDVSHVQAYRDIQSELNRLADLNHDKADELREIELQRIDRAIKGIMHFIDSGSATHVMALARLIQERAKLLGLYAPEKKDVNIKGVKTYVGFTPDDWDDGD